MLSVCDLHVNYGSVSALRGVSIDVAEKEIVSVIGPNGAGKSTLMLSIVGVVKPRSGEIVFQEESVLGTPSEKLVGRGISLVPEGRRIFATLSVGENIGVGAVTRSDRAEVRRDTDWVLEMFPILRERFQQRAGQLSGGEQQMLAIARALLARPKLLIIDEPSLGLAPVIVDKVYAALERLREAGLTLLIVEQNVHRALAASDRTYVMSTGEVSLTGRSEDLKGTQAFDDAYFGFADKGQSAA
jgi:branched-chain amino acid transport system ATP-binding protein